MHRPRHYILFPSLLALPAAGRPLLTTSSALRPITFFISTLIMPAPLFLFVLRLRSPNPSRSRHETALIDKPVRIRIEKTRNNLHHLRIIIALQRRHLLCALGRLHFLIMHLILHHRWHIRSPPPHHLPMLMRVGIRQASPVRHPMVDPSSRQENSVRNQILGWIRFKRTSSARTAWLILRRSTATVSGRCRCLAWIQAC